MKIIKELSAKEKNGKSQLMMRVWVRRDIRPRIKTGIEIPREYFDCAKKEIKIPKRTYFNAEKVKEAMDILSVVQTYESNVMNICNAGLDNVEITSEWILHVLSLIEQGFLLDCNNFSSILAAEKMEMEKKREIVSTLQSSPDYMIEGKENSNDASDAMLPAYTRHSFYIEAVNYTIRHNLSESRVRVYKVLGRQVCRFELFVQKTKNPNFVFDYNLVTPDDIEDFRYFIRHEVEIQACHSKLYSGILSEVPPCASTKFKKQVMKERGDNYVIGLMKKLKTVFSWLLKAGKTDNDPFKHIELGQELYGDPIYLTKQERDMIAKVDLSGYDPIYAQQRDIFIFQSLVGCRVGDLMTFRAENIQNGVLEFVPSKTINNESQVKVRVPLNPLALSLVEKYKGLDRRGRLFPFIAGNNYNDYIKKVFKIAGVNRIVLVRNTKTGKYDSVPICDIASSHMARRTFIGIAYRLTHDPNLIGKMTGHVEGSTAFCRYRKIEDEDLRSITYALA